MTGFSTQQYVAGYDTQVLKPVIPKLNIAVPTALKGTQSVTAPIVKTRVDNYVVNEPVHVQKPYAVPYDVVKHVEKIVEVPTPVHVQRPYEVPVPVPVRGQDIVKVPTPVHVQRPYEVPVPVPVRGQDIVKVSRTAPIVKHTHAGTYAAPAVGIAA